MNGCVNIETNSSKLRDLVCFLFTTVKLLVLGKTIQEAVQDADSHVITPNQLSFGLSTSHSSDRIINHRNMTRIALTLYVDPNLAEVHLAIKPAVDGQYHRMAAVVDTGAGTSFFPIDILKEIEHRIISEGEILIEQAGLNLIKKVF